MLSEPRALIERAVEAAKVAEVCAELATRHDRRGNSQIANWQAPTSHRIAIAYQAHLERIAVAIETALLALTPAPTPAREGVMSLSEQIREICGAAADFRAIADRLDNLASSKVESAIESTPTPPTAAGPRPLARCMGGRFCAHAPGTCTANPPTAAQPEEGAR